MTFSNLASEDRSILSLMKSVDYGRLEHLAIQDGHVVRTKDSRMIRFVKLGVKEVQRTSSRADGDFMLTEKHVEFLTMMHRIGNGIINTIQIQAGLPVSVETEETIAII